MAARSAAAESAGEQHERDGQGDHGAGERLLDPRHPGRVEEVADEDAEQIEDQDGADFAERRELPAEPEDSRRGKEEEQRYLSRLNETI